ncbi:MAG: hypothetical protein KDC39_02605 [Actinobacteria bacterium]|nr:hypothetical protein [Actinomycetota bacterium]
MDTGARPTTYLVILAIVAMAVVVALVAAANTAATSAVASSGTINDDVTQAPGPAQNQAQTFVYDFTNAWQGPECCYLK